MSEEKVTMDAEAQNKAVAYVSVIKQNYSTLCKPQKKKLRGIYEEVMSYESKKDYDWQSAIKVNFANQIETLVSARITAKNPKVLVSLREDPRAIALNYYGKEPETQEEIEEFNKFIRQIKTKWAPAIQNYLNTLQDTAGYLPVYRRLAKQLVRNGNAYGEVNYRYDLHRSKNKKTKKRKVKVAREYPMIDCVSFQELAIDPRYHQVADGYAVVRTHEKVSLPELYAQQTHDNDLMNLDKIQIGDNQKNWEREQIYSLMIPNLSEPIEVAANELTIDKFKGYYSPTGKPEDVELYEIWTVNSALLIKMNPIERIGLRSASCFEDTEQHFGIGYVEPILGLQDQYNFKLNSAIEYINRSLNRTYLWSEDSGIDPRTLIEANAPNAIIRTTADGPTAMANFVELPMKPLDSAYFAQQGELRSDMQTVSFTIDATGGGGAGGGTDSATATRAQFFDSNTVYADTLRHFEELVADLMYDVIDNLYDNLDDDKIIAALGLEDMLKIDRRVFEDAISRYNIRCEVGSSSFDSIENRREDVLAKLTVAERAAANGVEMDMQSLFTDLYGTFEEQDPEKYFKGKAVDPVKLLSGPLEPGFADMTPQPQQDLGSMQKLLEPNSSLNNVTELSKEVVQGNIVPGA